MNGTLNATSMLSGFDLNFTSRLRGRDEIMVIRVAASVCQPQSFTSTMFFNVILVVFFIIVVLL